MSYTAHAHEIVGTLSFAWATDATLGAGYGDLVSVDSDGIAMIRFHLEDDHPAVQDAIADGHNPEQAEFYAIVSVYDVTDQFGQPHRGAHQLFGVAKGKVETASEAEHRARIEAVREGAGSSPIREKEWSTTLRRWRSGQNMGSREPRTG